MVQRLHIAPILVGAFFYIGAFLLNAPHFIFFVELLTGDVAADDGALANAIHFYYARRVTVTRFAEREYKEEVEQNAVPSRGKISGAEQI